MQSMSYVNLILMKDIIIIENVSYI